MPTQPTTGHLAIRIADPDDAAALSELGARTFVEAFGADNTPEDVAAHLAATFTSERLAEEITDSSSRMLLAEIGSIPAGYAKLHWVDAPECVSGPEPVELARIYVLAEWHGHGVGRALMERCIEEALSAGAQTMWLGVWERNQGAIAFYRKLGFAHVGYKDFMLGSDRQHDWVMQRDLRQSPPTTA
ncbi:MAG TPA: GNAT family N-acetyltransferase [Candidatus Limnocylindrales bacterium]|nr:GNAT family N-acetyltransferase [Candidatus Limnocylindrales bacterium]